MLENQLQFPLGLSDFGSPNSCPFIYLCRHSHFASMSADDEQHTIVAAFFICSLVHMVSGAYQRIYKKLRSKLMAPDGK